MLSRLSTYSRVYDDEDEEEDGPGPLPSSSRFLDDDDDEDDEEGELALVWCLWLSLELKVLVARAAKPMLMGAISSMLVMVREGGNIIVRRRVECEGEGGWVFL